MTNKNTKKTIHYIELFAGVGGFRVGLDRASNKLKKLKKPVFNCVWSNQFEPGKSKNKQIASFIYTKKYGERDHSNEDIADVIANKFHDIPDHDLLVGGFPCQDYSVARTLNQASGIVGKKGVLWWEIHKILKGKKSKRPRFLLLENVDRMLKSPAKQRGRDFAIMLKSLCRLGYSVEWRVINAADYGMPQRRRRVFILGYLERTCIHNKVKKLTNHFDWLLKDGLLAQEFPVHEKIDEKTPHLLSKRLSFCLKGKEADVSEQFNESNSGRERFFNAGLMVGSKKNAMIYTVETIAQPPKKKGKYLGDIIVKDKALIPDHFFIDPKNEKKWFDLKEPKKIKRIDKKTGYEYEYSEGRMPWPDPLDRPSRTIITNEGGASPSRFKHVIKQFGKFRRLMPVELELLNMFDPGHTEHENVSDIERAFLMGNALVVGVIEKIGERLSKEVSKDI